MSFDFILRPAGGMLVITILLGCCGISLPVAAQEYFVHDNFDDGSIDDLSPVSWSVNGSVVDGDLSFVTRSPDGGSPITESGTFPRRDEWFLRARVTINQNLGLGFAGVGVSGSRWAAVFGNSNSFAIGEGFNPISRGLGRNMVGQEYIVQFHATEDLLQGHLWFPDSPGDIISIETRNKAGGTFSPTLANNGADATYHEVWMSSDPLPLPTEGDVDGNAVLGVGDIDLLTTQLVSGAGLDLNQDGATDVQDRVFWVEQLAGTFFGDANLDGEFNAGDMVAVLQAGEYEDAIVGNSTWSSGDWNGDGDFDSKDLVFSLQGGGFAQGPMAALRSVPPNPLDNIAAPHADVTLGGSYAALAHGDGVARDGQTSITYDSKEFVLNDLTAVGSLAGGGDLGPVDLIYVPEPTSLLLAVLGAMALIGSTRRCR